MDDNDYRCLFLESLLVFIDFEDEYEVRASGVILDAMKYGCIVITSHHAICTEYNFPNSLITDMEGAVSLCQRDILELDKLEGLIPYSDESVFSGIWQEFLK